MAEDVKMVINIMDIFDQIIAYYNNNSSLISIISFFVGIIGIFLAIFMWYKPRSNATYDYLFKLAEKNLDKTITDQELSNKKKKIEITSQQIYTLQEKIRKDIPIEAKRTVLKDRLYSQI